MRVCLVVSLVLMCVWRTPYAAESDREPIPFSLSDSSDIVVAATIGGRGPFRVLLDTGSARSAVSGRIAGDLALQAVGRTTLVTPAGRSLRPLVRTAIDLGDEPAAVEAVVLGDADLPRAIEGIVGADVLAFRRFTIDYIDQRVSFDVREEYGPVSVTLAHGDNGFVVVLPQHDSAPPLRLIPDTGTRTIVLIGRGLARFPSITPLTPAVVSSLGGVRVGRSVVVEELRIGSIRLRDQPAVLITGSNADDRLGDGLLPLHLFARVTFDAPGGRLTLLARD